MLKYLIKSLCKIISHFYCLYGCAAYRVNNEFLQKLLKEQKEILEKARKELHDIHWSRKSNHDNLGLKLDEAVKGWNSKLAENYQLEEELNKMRLAVEAFRRGQLEAKNPSKKANIKF